MRQCVTVLSFLSYYQRNNNIPVEEDEEENLNESERIALTDRRTASGRPSSSFRGNTTNLTIDCRQRALHPTADLIMTMVPVLDVGRF